MALITYHSAYNFGSVLQAYAMEKIISRVGHEVKIINYRIPFQKKYYGLLGYGSGIRGIVKKFMMLQDVMLRKERAHKYEVFIQNLSLTNEVNSPSSLEDYAKEFDVYISGSDQIWNLHSNEFIKSGIEYMMPYLLSFTDKKKISYASSLVNMTDEELGLIKKELEKFEYISCREKEASQRIEELIHKKVNTVLDPTLLVDCKDWENMIDTPNDYRDYVFYYSLKDFKSIKKDLKLLAKLTENKRLTVVAVTPLIPRIRMRGVINVINTGPKDFLRLVRFSKYVITDSYHGVLFSIIFKKDFYYINNPDGDKGVRANYILSELNFKNRSLQNIGGINLDSRVDFNNSDYKLSILRTKSIEYINRSLDDNMKRP